MTVSSEENSRRNGSRNPGWWLWHRRLGLGFAVVFVVVVITGMVLNHTGGLRLDQRYVTTDWVLDWYGMAPAGEPVAYRNEGWAVVWAGQLYWEGQLVMSDVAGELRGVVRAEDGHAALVGDQLILFTSAGELIERLAGSDLPEGELHKIGGGGESVYLATNQGHYLSVDGLLSWKMISPAVPIIWSRSDSLPEAEREAVLRSYRGRGLSYYRVILDLHSGRFFGQAGVWLVDLASLAMLFLTGSGVWYALRGKRRY
jgi:hypothetical protein